MLRLGARRRHFFFELFAALVQSLQTQLPAMQLNAQLINVARDFGPLRFVFLEPALNFTFFLIAHAAALRRGGVGRDSCGLVATLTRERHAGGGVINDEWRETGFAFENDVAGIIRRSH